MQVVNDAVK